MSPSSHSRILVACCGVLALGWAPVLAAAAEAELPGRVAAPAKAAPAAPPAKAPAADAVSEDAPAQEEIEVETTELPSEAAEELDAAEDGGDAAGAGGTGGDAPPKPEGVEEVEVPDSEREREGVEFDDFYAGLSPHGSWVETREHGWVWVPYRQSEVEDWRPYMYGQWVWTRHGWTWVSEEEFGWATYHYGRWAFQDGLGWAWVPGYTWGPAWVVWRYGDEAIGWAPLYPGYVTYTSNYPFYTSHWLFIGPTYFYAYPVHAYAWHDHDHIYHHYHRSHWAQHWHYHGHGHVYAGPRRSHVARTSGRPVRTSSIEPSSRPARAGLSGGGKAGVAPSKVSIYRPDSPGAARPGGVRAPRTLVPSNPGAAGTGARRPSVGSGLDRVRSPSAVAAPGSVRDFQGAPGRPGVSPRDPRPGKDRGLDRPGAARRPSREPVARPDTGRAPRSEPGVNRPRPSSPRERPGAPPSNSYRPGGSGGSRPSGVSPGARPRPRSGPAIKGGGDGGAVRPPAAPPSSGKKSSGKKGKKK